MNEWVFMTLLKRSHNEKRWDEKLKEQAVNKLKLQPKQGLNGRQAGLSSKQGNRESTKAGESYIAY